MANIVKKHKRFLAEKIRDAQEAEEIRISRLQKCKNVADSASLNARYAGERARDQENIKNLTEDYKRVKEKYETGQLKAVDSTRKVERQIMLAQGNKSNATSDADRFAGFDTYEDKMFQKGINQMFEKHDKRFKRCNTKSFDYAEENRKLKLLNEKRQLLTQLINLNEYGSQNTKPAYSDSYSTTSSLTYATFNSASREQIPKRSTNFRPNRPHVPKLNLS